MYMCRLEPLHLLVVHEVSLSVYSTLTLVARLSIHSSLVSSSILVGISTSSSRFSKANYLGLDKTLRQVKAMHWAAPS